MKTFRLMIIIVFFAAIFSCNFPGKPDNTTAKAGKALTYAKEPNDSSGYKLLKYNFYLNTSGQLCERKLAMARDSSCNCEFEVYYDSCFSIYTEDTILKRPLSSVIDIDSFVWPDSTEYAKDKRYVYYFHNNSDGGNRVIVNKADPLTFNRLCEYRWGIDKNYVFYKGEIVEGLNLKYLQVLYPPDTADHFIQYIKDDKNVFYETQLVKGADPKTFKVVSGQQWKAEDKNYKYETGRRQK